MKDGTKFVKKYAYAPKRFALRVMTRGPNHIPMNRLVKASSLEPEVPKAPIEAVIREISKGPHRSHCCLIF